MQYQLITADQQLAECCQAAQIAPRIALDTEFVRTRTLYPKLGLIQLYDGATLSLIDPLKITDWTALCLLLQNPQVEKIVHAAGEDVETLQQRLGVFPTPLLDTQILAAFNGAPLSNGFACLVNRYLQVELTKKETRTDWLARPLNNQQLAYAAADVYYLLPLAQKLMMQIKDTPWLAAARDESHLLLQRRTRPIEPNQLYQHISHAWRLSPRRLACLQKLAAWRFNEARVRDLALNFIATEAQLWQIAHHLPSSLSALQGLDIPPVLARRYGKHILKLIEEAQQTPEHRLPPPLVRWVEDPAYKRMLQKLQQFIEAAAQQYGLNKSLLASQRQLHQLLAWHWCSQSPKLPVLLMGWRGKLLGDKLLTLLTPSYNEQYCKF